MSLLGILGNFFRCLLNVGEVTSCHDNSRIGRIQHAAKLFGNATGATCDQKCLPMEIRKVDFGEGMHWRKELGKGLLDGHGEKERC